MPLLLIAIGMAMMASALSGKKKRPEETRTVNPPEILLPSSWNEDEITRGMERYQQNRGLLSSYVDGIVSRFVMNQDIRTMQVRTQFLEQFNKSAAVAREAYKWQRYLQGGRAKDEEDAADLRAKLELEKARKELLGLTEDPELAEIQKQVDRLNLRLQLASVQKQIDDLNRPAVSPAPAPPSQREIRERRQIVLAEREKEVRKAIRETDEDRTLEEDLKQRKLNGLYDKLSEVHEEQAKLL
jgi:hypothetical protein